MQKKNWLTVYVFQMIPILSIIIYILGFAYYIPYYYCFGINIVSYISFPEVLIITLIPICISFGMMCSFYWGTMIGIVFRKQRKPKIKKARRCIYLLEKIGIPKISGMLSSFEKQLEKLKIYRFLISKKNIAISQKSVINQIISVLSLFLGSLLCFIASLILFGSRQDDFILSYIFSFLFFIMFLGLFRDFIKEFNRIRFNFIKIKLIVFMSSILIPVLAMSLAYKGAHSAVQDSIRGKNRSFEIKTVDYNYSSDVDPNLFIIGECGTALFLYDKKAARTTVLNKQNILEINSYNPQMSFFEAEIMKFFNDYINTREVKKN